MPHARPHKRKKAPKRVLALPDLEHAKPAVLSSLTSRSGQRTLFREYVDEVSVECLRIGDFSNLSNQAESLPQDQIDVLTNKPARVKELKKMLLQMVRAGFTFSWRPDVLLAASGKMSQILPALG
jgi:hypothetical protein